MDYLNISEIQYFITYFLSPFIELVLATITVLFCLYGISFPKHISNILNKKKDYILYHNLYIPCYHTPLGKFINHLKKLYHKNLFGFIILITTAAYIIHISAIELHSYLPPQIFVTYKISEEDAIILSRIWVHFPEITNFNELYTHINTIMQSITPHWGPPYLKAKSTYILIQRVCKINFLLVLILNLFHNPKKNRKQISRSLIALTTISIIYSMSIQPYVNAFNYEIILNHRQVLEYLEKNNNIVYFDSDIKKYTDIIIPYSNDSLPDFHIKLFK